MYLVDNSQSPAADDINSDALEYLFEVSNPESNWGSPSWSGLVNAEPGPVARISPAYIRLQTKVEVMKGMLELTGEQLQSAHRQIGNLATELTRRNEMIKQLEDELVKRPISSAMPAAPSAVNSATILQGARQPKATASTAINATNYRRVHTKAFTVPLLAFNYLLMIGFAASVLATALR